MFRFFGFLKNKKVSTILLLVLLPVAVFAVQYVETNSQQHASANTCWSAGGTCIPTKLCQSVGEENCNNQKYSDCTGVKSCFITKQQAANTKPTACSKAGGRCYANTEIARGECLAGAKYCIPTSQLNLGCSGYCGISQSTYNAAANKNIRSTCSTSSFKSYPDCGSPNICKDPKTGKPIPSDQQAHVSEQCGRWYCDWVAKKQNGICGYHDSGAKVAAPQASPSPSPSPKYLCGNDQTTTECEGGYLSTTKTGTPCKMSYCDRGAQKCSQQNALDGHIDRDYICPSDPKTNEKSSLLCCVSEQAPPTPVIILSQ